MSRIHSSRILWFFILAILVCSLGCARKAGDSQISSQIQSKFSQDSGLASKQLTVQASNGVVTLSGFVDSDAQRDAASRQAASVEGVKEVVNNLQVGNGSNASANSMSAPPSSDTAGAEPVPFKETDNKRTGRDAARRRRESADNNSAANNSAANNSNTMAQNSEPAQSNIQNQPPADVPPPAPPQPPQPRKITIEQGTQLTIRLIDSIDSEKNQVGDTFHATLNAPISAEGMEAIPAGTDVAGHIVDLKSAGKFAGRSLVVLQLDSISSNGRSYNLQTDQYRKEGGSRGKNTAEKVGGGAIIGGIIGAIAGGGKGAAIGSAAGAGVGGGVQAASKKQAIKLPSETVLNFTLQAPVTVLKAPERNVERQKLSESQ
ncbi:MAG TPA: BON domain-containing protein [Candidatus Sulfotelmatobacter sp.]|nr:BON domain-containing protein [Candidatus Sulfotelmatobacter sp.]